MSDQDKETSYPLAWPAGWPRHKGARVRARFGERGRGALLSHALDFLLGELERLGARDEVISTNTQSRPDGRPYARQPLISGDPGVAVYFSLKGKRTVLACDKWDRLEDNVQAIGLTIEAMRGRERWGVGQTEQAFAGYAALPPKRGKDCWEVLGLNGATLHSEEQVNQSWREKAKTAHPTRGGSMEEWNALNDAKDIALATIRSRGGSATC